MASKNNINDKYSDSHSSSKIDINSDKKKKLETKTFSKNIGCTFCFLARFKDFTKSVICYKFVYNTVISSSFSCWD